MKKKKLLILASTYPRWKNDYEPGFVHELAQRLIADFEVSVLCPGAKGVLRNELMDGVTVYRYRYAPVALESLVNGGGIISNLRQNRWKWILVPGFYLGQLLALRKMIRTFKPDVIHAHWLIPQGLAVAVLERLGLNSIPFVVTSHGADLFALRSSIFILLKKFVANRAIALTTVSSVMKEELKYLGVDSSKIEVCPMGVDLENTFMPDPQIDRSTNEILFVGRLVEKKGVRFLIMALVAIRKRFPDAFLSIVGFGPDLEGLKELADSLGLSSNVHFLGAKEQKNLPSFYQRAAVFVAPFIKAENGDQEGLGLVVVEALGCGCPAVISDLPACRDITDGINAVHLVPEGDVVALSEAICKNLLNVEELSSQVIASAEELKKRFDWNSVAKRYATKLTNACDLE
jgi:glycosyltransferase involved in cell wall biosynthesis